MEDLLSRIKRETNERLEELRGAVEERDRLQVDLRALDTVPEPPVDLEPLAVPEPLVDLKPPVDPEPLVVPEPTVVLESVDPELPVDPEPLVDLEPLVVPEPPVVPESPVKVTCFPGRRELPRTRMVSPKVARLMHAPRRPALERPGIARVSARADRVSARGAVDGIDA